MIVTASRFFRSWEAAAATHQDELLSKWNDATGYTDLIYYVLDDVAMGLKMISYYEYYSLDAVFYAEMDLVPGISKHNTWLRKIRVALEHENDIYSGLFQEVSHLLITNCDLRVLITYPRDNDEEGLESEMSRMHRLIDEVDFAQYIAESKSFLMIFGRNNGNGVCWEGRVFSKSGWVNLEPE